MNTIANLEDKDGQEYKVIVSVAIEPAQDGGMTDPSWGASWYVDAVHDMEGYNITSRLTIEDAESIDRQIEQQFEDEASDYVY